MRKEEGALVSSVEAVLISSVKIVYLCDEEAPDSGLSREHRKLGVVIRTISVFRFSREYGSSTGLHASGDRHIPEMA